MVATVPVGRTPSALVSNESDNKVYVANAGGSTVTVIDGVSNGVVATVPVGGTPHRFCYDSQDDRVYCANFGANTVSVIDGAGDTVVATIPVGAAPERAYAIARLTIVSSAPITGVPASQ